MKKLLLRLPPAILLMLPLLTLAQDAPPTRVVPPTVKRATNPSSPAVSPSQDFTQFDLDFPGGPPAMLVEMISRATGHPLNVIIPDDLATTSIPAIKLRNVTVPQLFTALAQASRKSVARIIRYEPAPAGGSPTPVYQIDQTSYGFFTPSDATPDSVWYFRSEGRPATMPVPTVPIRPKTCRFFQLAPYLEDYKVEDITTAVETAWKMLGRTNEDQPEMKFHKDTRLLIVVGSEDKVSMIDAVLKSLAPTPVAIDPTTGLPIPGSRPGRPPTSIGQPARP